MSDDVLIYDMSEDDLSSELMGKTITDIDEETNTITLSDGTELEFEDTYDCCAWFNASLTAGNLTDNAITSVVVAKNEYDHVNENDYDIHVLAGNNKIVDLNIQGDPTSGYYCHSINLRVRRPQQ